MKYFIGIDEVGRGSLAGPVVAGAVLLPQTSIKIYEATMFKKAIVLRDSKRLSARQRERWAEWLKKQKDIFWAVAGVPAKEIDKIGISKSANRAAGAAFKKILKKSGISISLCDVYLDAGLSLKTPLSFFEKTHPYGWANKTNIRTSDILILGAVKADEKIPAVALASIVAKVYRDEQMRHMSEKHQEYGFEKHKGYGTAEHITAIKKHGLSVAHRKSFCKNFI